MFYNKIWPEYYKNVNIENMHIENIVYNKDMNKKF